MLQNISRRNFLLNATGAAVAGRGSARNSQVRVGVVGLGDRGTAHVRGFLRLNNALICALCDINERRLRRHGAAVAMKRPLRPELFRDFRALLQGSGIDAVSIAVPPDMRTEMAVAACRAGKHVLLEQPFAVSGSDATKIEAAAARHHVLVDVAWTVAGWDLEAFLAEPRRRGILPASTIFGEDILTGKADGSKSLAQFAFDGLAVVRRALRADRLNVISANSFVARNPAGTESLALAFNFDSGAALRWEIRRVPVETGIAVQRRTSIRCASASGEMASLVEFGACPYAASPQFGRFVAAIRQGRPDLLSFPIGEARQVHSMIELALNPRCVGRPARR